jgi:hypothetical protein
MYKRTSETKPVYNSSRTQRSVFPMLWRRVSTLHGWMRKPRMILREGQTVKFKSWCVVRYVWSIVAPTPRKLYKQRAAVTRIQKPIGAVSQMWAGLTHHVEAKRLAQISETIPKVLILTGDQDHLIRPSHSAYMSKQMPKAEFIVWKDTGHVVSMQHVERFNTLLERVFLEGQARLDGS